MQTKKLLVGVVIYNEEEKLKEVIQKIKKTLRVFRCTFLLVNDHSSDNSLNLIKDFVKKNPRTILINNNKNSGVGKSIKKIIDYGIKHKFDVCVIMAGNGKDNPLEIGKLFKPIFENNVDYVQGSRFLNGGSYNNLPFARKIMIKGFTFIVWLFTGFYGTDASNGFRAYKLSLFQDKRINIHQEWLNRYEFETYFHYKILTLGYKVREVPVSKNYLFSVKSYSKIKPFIDWWKMISPLIYLKMGWRN